MTRKNSRKYQFFWNIKMTTYWIDRCQLELTCQVRDLDHEIIIASYKINQNKLWSSILNQFNVEKWNWKKN
jgi:hypothetical protein